MRHRYQRNRDVFDTGPFGGYRSLGNGDDENGGEVSSEKLQQYYNGFYYSYNTVNWSVYDSAMTLLETGSYGSDSASNYQAAINWGASGSRYFVCINCDIIFKKIQKKNLF